MAPAKEFVSESDDARELLRTADWCQRATRRSLGVQPIEIDAGHCPHSTRPREIADVLERLAQRDSGRFAVPASEQVRINIALPETPTIRGAVLTTQALTASVAAGFRFSTPATFVLN